MSVKETNHKEQVDSSWASSSSSTSTYNDRSNQHIDCLHEVNEPSYNTMENGLQEVIALPQQQQQQQKQQQQQQQSVIQGTAVTNIGTDEVINNHPQNNEATPLPPNVTPMDINKEAESAGESKWSKNAYGETLDSPGNSGKFTKTESDLVRQSIQDYCSKNGLTASGLITCNNTSKSLEIKGAWVEISKTLPHRSVQSVYRHGLRIMHPFKRGVWSEEETSALVENVKKYGKKWSTIQGLIHRSADACRDKYREFSCEYDKGRWKDYETDQLLIFICECFKLDPSQTDLGTLIQTVQQSKPKMHWNDISKKMVKRSRLGCFKRWKKISSTSDESRLSQKISSYNRPSTIVAKSNEPSLNNIASESASSKINLTETITTMPPTLAQNRSISEIIKPIEACHEKDTSNQLPLAIIATAGISNCASNSCNTFEAVNNHENFIGNFDQQTVKTYETEVVESSNEHHNHDSEEDQAEMAARTVEAVDLPLVPMI